VLLHVQLTLDFIYSDLHSSNGASMPGTWFPGFYCKPKDVSCLHIRALDRQKLWSWRLCALPISGGLLAIAISKIAVS